MSYDPYAGFDRPFQPQQAQSPRAQQQPRRPRNRPRGGRQGSGSPDNLEPGPAPGQQHQAPPGRPRGGRHRRGRSDARSRSPDPQRGNAPGRADPGAYERPYYHPTAGPPPPPFYPSGPPGPYQNSGPPLAPYQTAASYQPPSFYPPPPPVPYQSNGPPPPVPYQSKGLPPRDPRDAGGATDLIRDRIRRERPCRTLFVRNIAYDTSPELVRERFDRIGEIKAFFDLVSTRGMVFVTYFDLRPATMAKEQVNGTDLAGRQVDVHYSLPKDLDTSKRCERDKNQGTLILNVRGAQQPLIDAELWDRFGQFGELKAIVGGPELRRDERRIEYWDSRAPERAKDALDGQRMVGGTMAIELEWDVTEEPIPPLAMDRPREYRDERGGSRAGGYDNGPPPLHNFNGPPPPFRDDAPPAFQNGPPPPHHHAPSFHVTPSSFSSGPPAPYQNGPPPPFLNPAPAPFRDGQPYQNGGPPSAQWNNRPQPTFREGPPHQQGPPPPPPFQRGPPPPFQQGAPPVPQAAPPGGSVEDRLEQARKIQQLLATLAAGPPLPSTSATPPPAPTPPSNGYASPRPPQPGYGASLSGGPPLRAPLANNTYTAPLNGYSGPLASSSTHLLPSEPRNWNNLPAPPLPPPAPTVDPRARPATQDPRRPPPPPAPIPAVEPDRGSLSPERPTLRSYSPDPASTAVTALPPAVLALLAKTAAGLAK